jgi:uncharacterized protein YdhG (YjbR/CyaY superfamily)
MKKAKSGNRKIATKSGNDLKSVEEYFAGVAPPARSALIAMRAAIRSVMPPNATETISYKIPAFKLDRVLVWYAAFSTHCSLFPTAAVIHEFRNELKRYSTSKGTVHFSTDKPLPIPLIKKMVKARVEQNAGAKSHSR